MTQRHEERYKRAVARITQERRVNAERRALIELKYLDADGFPKMPAMYYDIEAVKKLAAHKLGERFAV